MDSTGLTRLREVSRSFIPYLNGAGIPWGYSRTRWQLRRSSFHPGRLGLPGQTSRFWPSAIATVGDCILTRNCGRANPLTMTQIVITGLYWSYWPIGWLTNELTLIELGLETTASGRIPQTVSKFPNSAYQVTRPDHASSKLIGGSPPSGFIAMRGYHQAGLSPCWFPAKRVYRHVGLSPMAINPLRVYRQWQLTFPIGNNGELRWVATDVLNLLQNVARSKSKASGRWVWPHRSCQNPDVSFQKLTVWELRKNVFRPELYCGIEPKILYPHTHPYHMKALTT